MRRPSVSAMDEIESIFRDISVMENAIAELKERSRTLPAKVARQLKTPTARRRASWYLYWMFPKLSAEAIASGLLGTNIQRFQKVLRSIKVTIKCKRCKCNKPIRFRNRSHMPDIRSQRFQILCKECSKEVEEESERKEKAYEAMNRTRLRTLKALPYTEYLKTPYWRRRRQEHLEGSGYSCQVCNASKAPLDVHHRTYERRGHEYYTDLLTLCRDCHELFHRAGKLIK